MHIIFEATSCIWISTIAFAVSVWISSDHINTLPQPDSGMAIGSYNQTIFIIGGMSGVIATEWNINTKSVVDSSDKAISAFGSGQFWTQHTDILYVINPFEGGQISTFNMKTQVWTDTWQHITTRTVGDVSCLTSSEHYLFVVGGADEIGIHKAIQMFELSTQIWLTETVTMTQERGGHACLVHGNKLWIFGGYEYDYNRLSTNEYMDISTLTSLNDMPLLTAPASDLRAVSSGNDIYIIGGMNSSYLPLDTVHIFNVITHDMALSVPRLLYAVSGAATILVDNTIYVFGGDLGYSEYTNTWMYYELPMANAIHTYTPSSANPTVAPSQMTTAALFQSPSEQINTNTETTMAIPSNDHNSHSPSRNFLMTTSYYPSQSTQINVTAVVNVASVISTFKHSFHSTNSSQSTLQQHLIWNGTVINITVIVNDSTSINELVTSINNTVILYLRAYDIRGALDTDIITKGTTIIVVVLLDHKLETTHINSKEMERRIIEVLDDPNVKNIQVKVENTKNEKNNSYNTDNNIWITLVIIGMIVLLSITMVIVLVRKYGNNQRRSSDQLQDIEIKDSNKVKDRDPNEDMLNEKEGYIEPTKIGKTKGYRLFDEFRSTGDSIVMDKRTHNNLLEVQNWMESEVKLPEYFNVFIKNGYESMQIIKEISNTTELKEMGIVSIQHQIKMLEEIEKWKYENIVEENRKGEGSYWNKRLKQRSQVADGDTMKEYRE